MEQTNKVHKDHLHPSMRAAERKLSIYRPRRTVWLTGDGIVTTLTVNIVHRYEEGCVRCVRCVAGGERFSKVEAAA